MKIEYRFIILAFSLIIIGVFIAWVTKDVKRETATYTIVSGNDRTYYTQTFRMMGKGIVFDDVYGKKIILMGDIDIQYKEKGL